MENQSYKNMFYYECMKFADEIGPEKIQQLQYVFKAQSYENAEEIQSNIVFRDFTPHSNSHSSNSLDFFSILESAIREADRKWKEDEIEQQNKKKRKQKGMDRN